jgi:hypothetical protein
MFTPITPDELEKLVNLHYQFLLDDFGFSIKKVGDYKFVAESKNVKVHIDVEHAVNVLIEIEPAGEAASFLLKQNIIPGTVSIISVSEYYDSNLEYKAEMIDENNFIDNVPVELEREALLLQKYCTKMLRGDFSDWMAVKENILARRRMKKI